MVEYELTQIVQMVSQIATATGVIIAAIYYIMNLRNADREKRRQTILMKLPQINLDYYNFYLDLDWNLNFKTPEEFFQKYPRNLQVEPKIWYIMNIFNTLGILYQEGLMTLEEIAKLYSPLWIINFYQRFSFMFMRTRYDSEGKPLLPESFVPYEKLFLAMNDKYPETLRLKEYFRDENRNPHDLSLKQ